jgi:putative colanic acid biosynthesis UDP-glucose lipid carrier transferase
MTLKQPSVTDHFSRVTAGDPSVVFFVNTLLSPVVVLLTLTISLLIFHVPFAGPYLLVAFLAFVGVADFLKLPKFKGRRSVFDLLRFLLDICLRWAVVLGIILALLYFAGTVDRLNPDVIRTWIFATPFMLWAGQLAGLHWGLYRVPARRAVVVGLTDLGIRLKSRLSEDPLMCTDMIGFFEDRSTDRIPSVHRQNILGQTVHLPQFILNNEVDIVYITLPMTRHPRIINLLDVLRDSTVSIYFVPDLFVFNLIQARFDLINDIPVVSVRESPFYGYHGISKRICDLTVAIVAAVTLSPLFLAISIGIKLSSPGPVLFLQKRYGLDGKPMVVYKFRSMTVTEDGVSSYTQVIRNDSRVTKFGALLRRTSLDELPQLFNVIEGSMSIVGPRPHAVAVNEQYRRLIPSYMVRHKVKPGITGLAQVNGYRGGDDLESMTKRIEFDLMYLSHWSLRMDLLIMIKTAYAIWYDKKAF